MTAQELFNQLPFSLQTALAVAVADDEFAHLGSEELRHVARHLFCDAPLDPAVLDILAETLDEWLDQQSRLAEHAAGVYDRLQEAEPLVAESSSFPGWFKPWAEVLRQPWSERLPVAILDGETYLSSLT